MSNPQAENGHTDIANEIMEALARTRIPGEARQVLDFIIRKTYGWHKKEDRIPLSQFVDGTGLRKKTVCKVIKKLKEMNLIITQLGDGITTTYSFNKHFGTWKASPKKGISPNMGTRIPQKGDDHPPIGDTQKKSSKETISKEKYLTEFEIFWSIYPKKTGKAPCLKKWDRIIKSKADAEKITIALQNQIRLRYISKDIKYCPNPLTWLNQERWNDEIVETRQCNRCGQTSTFYLEDDNSCKCGGKYVPHHGEKKRK